MSEFQVAQGLKYKRFAIAMFELTAHLLKMSSPAHIHRFPDIYHILDDDLKRKLVYAWSLPHNPRFVGKLQMVHDIASSLKGPYPIKSMAAYIVRTVRQIVTVNILFWLTACFN
jgi:hypothetical protein